MTVLLDPDEANDSSRVLITAGAAFVKGEVISESIFNLEPYPIQILHTGTL